MAVSPMHPPLKLSIGPLLFHWPIEMKRDYYFRIADEAPVDVVYLGEVVCSKRDPFSAPHYPEIAERLVRGGKEVVFCSLAEVVLARERRLTRDLCSLDGYDIEVNDAAALFDLSGRRHRIGQYVNVYNEETLRHLAGNGAAHFALPVELPRQSVAALAAAAAEVNAGVELQVFGRMPLALSSRCYHARAHGRTKDNCMFVCENDPDGMTLRTLDEAPWLTINGVQTMSYPYLSLLPEIEGLARLGVTHARLSPHTADMTSIAALFRAAADGALAPEEAEHRLLTLGSIPALANGFWHGREGGAYVAC